jgi:3-(3-hydroxy-phenyl)propionate hydroxylase
VTAQTLPVVVLGAGPTGITAATLLAQQGLPVLVLDRWADVFPQPRAVHLDDEIYRLLGRIGAADAFAAITRPSLGLRLLDHDHRVLTEFRRTPGAAQHGYPQANMFDQPDFERVLRQNLQRFAAVTLRGDAEVTAVTQTDESARVAFTDRTTGEQLHVDAQYVLACDGANSLTRTAIGGRMQDLGFEQRWLVVDVATDAELDVWDGTHQVCDTRRAGTYMRVGATRYRWEFRLLDGETAGDYAEPQRLLSLLAPWTGTLGVHQLEVVRRTEYTFRAQVADRWRDRRVFLLGDAAHLTPPFIGQGMGAGLRDAANLAWKLAGVLRGELDVAVLGSYEVERKPHATAMVRLAVTIGNAMTAGGRLGAVLRRVIAPRLHLLPGMRARVLDSESPRLHRSALVHRPRLAGPLPGRLAPNAPLGDGTRLDAVDPTSFLVVSAGSLSPAQRAAVERRGAVLLETAVGEALHAWLRAGRATVAVVRPDATVLAAGSNAEAVLARLPAYAPPRLRTSA